MDVSVDRYKVGQRVKIKYLPPNLIGVWGGGIQIGDEITIEGIGSIDTHLKIKARYNIQSDDILLYDNKFYYVFPDWVETAPPSQKEEKKQCNCTITELMRYGCQCGAMQ